jgi:hypothetical protein
MPLAGGKAAARKGYKLAKKHKEFRWVLKVSPAVGAIFESGWERVDGSSIYEWFMFSRLDMNNNGYGDWYVIAPAAVSTGGDRDFSNTLYLGGVPKAKSESGFTDQMTIRLPWRR